MQVAAVQAESFVGKRLGNYSIEKLIGQGQWNAVYQARIQSQHPVLLTIFFLPETFSKQARTAFMERLYKEGASLIKLQHANILSLEDVGERSGYPYLVTPFVAGNSLAHILKRVGHFTPSQALDLVKPLAAALDYAHSLKVMHGTLSLANILIDDKRTLRVINFGLNRLGALQGLEVVTHQYAHLVSITGTPLTALEYMAPEVVQGAAVREPADVYSAGLILFELLCGTLPFSNMSPVEAALQHVKQDIPAPSSINKEVPAALDLIVGQVVAREQEKRFATFSSAVRSIESTLQVLAAASAPVKSTRPAWDLSLTLPPTVDWAAEEIEKPAASWLLKPTGVTNHLAAAAGSSAVDNGPATAPQATQAMQQQQVSAFNNGPSIANYGNNVAPLPYQEQGIPRQGAEPAAFANRMPLSTQRRQNKQTETKDRKKVALLAAGGVVTVGAIIAGAIGLTDMWQNAANSQTDKGQQQNKALTSTTPTAPVTATPMSTSISIPVVPTAAPVPATAANTTTQAQTVNNGTKSFINPVDGAASILVPLGNGNYAAYEKACTHQGIAVYYDSATKRLVCPAHGATFDPAQRGEAQQGPTIEPLIPVAVRVNADGTITPLG